MKRQLWISIMLIVTLAASFTIVQPTAAMPPYPEDSVQVTAQDLEARLQSTDRAAYSTSDLKFLNQRNPVEVQRIQERLKLLKEGNTIEANALAKIADDRVLVILVEFAGTDTFTWDPLNSRWDPLGIADPAEDAGEGDCSVIAAKIAEKMGVDELTEPIEITYGPTLHNELPRPISAADRSGDTIWTEDFSKEWFDAFMFGDGIKFDYTRQDGSVVYEDFTGQSVRQYYNEMSGGLYDIEGDIIGWIPLDHSATWYGSDECPGRRSVSTTSSTLIGAYGNTPGAGTAQTMVFDALTKVEEMRAAGELPGFDWANYDLDGNGVIDRLWVVHAGYGEEDSTVLLNRVAVDFDPDPGAVQFGYGESAVWSHSSSLPNMTIPGTSMKVGPYITMPENGGIGVFAHEYAHNLGANDLYAYTGGETSAGFWTLMADDWTGYPIGYQPPALDPMHLDWWGWLNPRTIVDPTQVYTVTLGQAGEFPGGEGVYRGAKIILPEGRAPLGIMPYAGSYMFWGGKAPLINSMMTLKTPIAVPAEGGSLEFQLVYDIETEWDFLWVQASTDGGETWDFLKSPNMICTHDPSWIGYLYGLPDDLCAADIYGFSGWTASYPDYELETFDLAAYAGQNVLIRFWYMTDWGTEYVGPFLDEIKVTSGVDTLFYDGAEAGPDNWEFADLFTINDGYKIFDQAYYLQWRNVGDNGGYDSGLGDPRFRYGPTNTGLLVWYNNGMYGDNEIMSYLTDYPSFGPKGQMLVVDAHGDPYRNPDLVAAGYPNEAANLVHRMLMRDAPFSLNDSVDFLYGGKKFTGRPLVDFFDDAFGYYPGAEFVDLGPYQSWAWLTKQWDASAVIPATDYYTINAPGYNGMDPFRFGCSLYTSGPYAGYVGCYWYPSGIGYPGSTGNPSEFDAHYGWRVQVVDESVDGTTATVKIWNTRYNGAFTPDKTRVNMSETVTYSYQIPEFTMDTFCVDLQTDRMTYVSSVNMIPLAQTCDEVIGTPVRAITSAEVKAVAWVPQTTVLGVQVSRAFSFTVQPKLLETRFNLNLGRYSLGKEVFALPANTVVVTTDKPFSYWMPALFK